MHIAERFGFQGMHPSTCSRCCRVPQSWPTDAKSASKKLSPATTTGMETPVCARVLRPLRGVRCDYVAAVDAGVFHQSQCSLLAELPLLGSDGGRDGGGSGSGGGMG